MNLHLVDKPVRRVLAAFFPQRCALCRAPIVDGPVCGGCKASLPWIANPCRGCAMPLRDLESELCAACLRSGRVFDHAWAAFALTSPVQGLVHELKYSADFAAAHVLGSLAAWRLASRPQPLPDVIVPVPLHASRQRMRGYNQALQLARALHDVLAIGVAPSAAERVRKTEDQIGQSASQRRKNLKGAFAIREPMRGASIALIDDVMTTGATLAELSHAFREAGARRVEAWAIARAL